MLKINKVKFSGFRGILASQELLLKQGGNPQSLVIYGLNSSGKTSFVDGLEWFLSPNNEIEWLKREDAGIKAYTHLEAKEGNSYVEIEFNDDKKVISLLTKKFNNEKITKPLLSSVDDFNIVYNSFIIRPYLRYLEIIDFVFNRTGVEKYQKLASWMGFEKELAFQETIALHILPSLRKFEDTNVNLKQHFENELKVLINNDEINEANILDYCNDLLKPYKVAKFSTKSELETKMPEIEKLKSSSESANILSVLSKNELAIEIVKFNPDIDTQFEAIKKLTVDFTSKKKVVEKIDYINLYNQAFEILNKSTEEKIDCPVCGTGWDREKLITHIKDELALLEEVKIERDKIKEKVSSLTIALKQEKTNLEKLLIYYKDVCSYINAITFDTATQYEAIIKQMEQKLDGTIFEDYLGLNIGNKLYDSLLKEQQEICALISKEKKLIEPSKEEVKRSEDIERVKKIIPAWTSHDNINHKLAFYQQQIKTFLDIANELSEHIQESVSSRFKDISTLIGKYFSILRNDKDIKDIQISLNQDKGRAIGRSAEIQLSYYNISVKPAYKVLSESLLNSLGLAVYFACIRKFNIDTKFVILDDIMNSLDTGHRDTLLDLIEKEFADYQVILFTHDLHWFERIQRRFPTWIKKKIKSWDYEGGPKIDVASTTLDEIKEMLKDTTKAKDAGSKFGGYIEGILNELCEDLHAELRYRFNRNDPPSMEELLEALHKRLKDKLNKNPIVELVENAKKFEPLMRNSTTHPRQNYSSTISPQEVQRVMDEWEKVHNSLWCGNCNKYVSYIKELKTIQCKCGKMKLEKMN